MTKLKENVQVKKDIDPYAAAKHLNIYKQIESTNDMTTDKIVERIIENRLR